mmetsp:Transcript_28523/g.28897  ORF Transcript_28523/g.28897 Transcript_28523/m.28897 type:complete len:105 (-) Transcript_28523:659-973(-)
MECHTYARIHNRYQHIDHKNETTLVSVVVVLIQGMVGIRDRLGMGMDVGDHPRPIRMVHSVNWCTVVDFSTPITTTTRKAGLYDVLFDDNNNTSSTTDDFFFEL